MSLVGYLYLIILIISIWIFLIPELQKFRLIVVDIYFYLLLIGLIIIWQDAFSIVLFYKPTLTRFVEIFLLSGVIYFYRKKHLFFTKAKNMVIISLFSIILVMTIAESFNGILSFDNQHEFYHLKEELKQYYKVTPVKIMPVENYRDEYGRMYYVFNILSPIRPQQVQWRNGELYYMRYGGWGELGTWFKFGIPESKQAL